MKKRTEELAYEKVKRAIMLKRLNPGQRITEDWVSQELNMSRTPIRAAFKRLESEGLIQLVPHKGAFVCNPSNKELEDVFHLRIMLEGYAAQLAINHISENDLKEFEQLLEQEIASYKSRDFEEFMHVNGLIHSFAAKIADNKFLMQQVETLNQWSDCYLILRDEFYTTELKNVKSIPEHKAIYDAYQKKDLPAVKKAIELHLLSTLSDLSNQESIFS
ncbi:GntR family transcriptional regulator [Jeotgalibacillus sp. S-D1]|uniref:GntR family transcriptional regulator n=1 Tax=Jeotgalibacillus sp. S-D1 TaxID=2552189 RepID=UPI00105A4E2B|nr:GntR family transcriptional regulator [Jeotgalibacillus sp. S-D1]TDL31060.1 GntR family transcriptional regulator [Jeotgalibacillus sp. S-D1]